MIGTRPDITFVLIEITKYVSKPWKTYLVAATRVSRSFNFHKISICGSLEEKVIPVWLLRFFMGLSGTCFLNYWFFTVLTEAVSWCACKKSDQKWL
jgi:hypothetical protein